MSNSILSSTFLLKKANQKINYSFNFVYQIKYNLFFRLILFLVLQNSSLDIHAKTIFVNDDAIGSNNGMTWSDAFTNLQSALNIAISGDEIWVAKGIYTPTADATGNTNPSNNRMKTFAILENVKIFGSFQGNEILLNQRTSLVMAINQSKLNGDLLGDDIIGNFNVNRNENCEHVVYSDNLTNASVLDGFTISGGNSTNQGGGGIYNSFSSPSFNNIILYDNSATRGGGMYNASANSVKLSNVIFSENYATTGGGLDNGASTVNLNNCIFINNKSNFGGAIFHDGGTLTVNNNTFFRNSAANQGGALYIFQCNSSIKNSIFWDNKQNGSSTTANSDIIVGLSSPIILENTALQLENNKANYAPLAFTNINTSNNIFAQNPLFVDENNPAGIDGIFRTFDDGLILSTCSPLIDKANPTTSTPFDILTNLPVDIRDMGSYETFKGIACSLPLELLLFEAQIKVTNVKLHWQTANEQNVEYFVVERSQNTSDFNPINSVKAKNNIKQSYEVTDEKPLLGTSYYRLKMVDEDGSSQYSAIKSVRLSATNKLSFYPNPASDFLNIQFTENMENEFSIANLLGQILVKCQVTERINIEKLPSGTYLFMLNNQHFKFVKL
jgi:Secretion system C-terminal sorting domain